MKAYVLSILGIVVASVFIDLFMPSGQTSKYIKSIYAIFVVYVLLTPVINFVVNKKNLSDFLTEEKYSIVETYIDNFYESKIIAYQNEIISVFESKGIQDVELSIDYNVENNSLIILKVDVNLKNAKIMENAENCNLYTLSLEIIDEVISETVQEVNFV